MPVPVKTYVRMFTGAGRAYPQRVYALHVDAPDLVAGTMCPVSTAGRSL